MGQRPELVGFKENEWEKGKGDLPLDGNGKLPGPRDRLYDDVRVLDAALGQLRLCALEQRRDDGLVPARMHDADAQGAAVVLLWLGTFEGVGSHCRRYILYGLSFLVLGPLACTSL